MNCIKQFFVALMCSIRFYRGGAHLGGSRVIKTGVREYNIFVNDDAIAAVSGIIPTFPMCGVVLISGDRPAYLCNEAFLKQDSDFIECCMAHEEAHIVNKDYLRKPSLLHLIRRWYKEFDYEFQADRYAYDLLGYKYIIFLRNLGEFKFKHICERIKTLQEVHYIITGN